MRIAALLAAAILMVPAANAGHYVSHYGGYVEVAEVIKVKAVQYVYEYPTVPTVTIPAHELALPAAVTTMPATMPVEVQPVYAVTGYQVFALAYVKPAACYGECHPVRRTRFVYK